MALVLSVGNDRAHSMRWSAVAHGRGDDCMILTPESFAAGSSPDADLCLYDLGPRAGGDTAALIDAIERHPGTRFVAMTARPEAREGLRLLQYGVRGYCNRQASAAVLATMLDAIAQGEVWAGRQVTDFLLAAALSADRPKAEDPSVDLDQLTEREAEIAARVGAGHSNKVIAAESGVTERTVKAHLNAVYRKTGIRNRVQLALAWREGQGRSLAG